MPPRGTARTGSLTQTPPASPAAATQRPAAWVPQHDGYTPLTAMDWDDRFSRAIILSAIVHTLVVFWVHFKPTNPRLLESPNVPLEVVMVNTPGKERPLKPDVLAQTNLEGGGNTPEERQAKSPLPPGPEDSPTSQEDQLKARVEALDTEARKLMKRIKSQYAIPDETPERVEAPEPTPTPAPTDLASRSLEMARLAARIDEQWDSYQKYPRRTYVGARTAEYSFARYVEDWRLKVERIGNLNYPEAARRQRLYGSLVLSVAIRQDGSIESIQVDRSSGSKILDIAAAQIVDMAGPYAPFPADMRKRTDVLVITRTWTFTRSDQLTSQ